MGLIDNIKAGIEQGLQEQDTTDLETELHLTRIQAIGLHRWALDIAWVFFWWGFRIGIGVSMLVAIVYAIGRWWLR
jgi:hypothetical protein